MQVISYVQSGQCDINKWCTFLVKHYSVILSDHFVPVLFSCSLDPSTSHSHHLSVFTFQLSLHSLSPPSPPFSDLSIHSAVMSVLQLQACPCSVLILPFSSRAIQSTSTQSRFQNLIKHSWCRRVTLHSLSFSFQTCTRTHTHTFLKKKSCFFLGSPSRQCLCICEGVGSLPFLPPLPDLQDLYTSRLPPTCLHG